MLERIYGELAKLIAKDIYDAAKKAPGMLAVLNETTTLRTSGSGLPEAVLESFDKTFDTAMSSTVWRGSAKWRAGGSEESFNFYFTSDIVAKVLKSNWAEAASRTADGALQVRICGGTDSYNKLIAAVVPGLVERAIEACVGTYHGSTDVLGWEVLAHSQSIPVAHRGKTDFTPQDIFYMAHGGKKETSKTYKSATRFLHTKWFGLSDPPAPFEGPYLS